jgi:hypothetical protein
MTICGEAQNPGRGGWPTHRYFNSDTGCGGKAYPKKTQERICVELSKENGKYMREYVNDFAPKKTEL